VIDITQEIIGSSLRIATPLALAALGELVTEKSGVLNLGIEGIMYGSAFVGIATAAQTGSLSAGLFAGFITGAVAGLIFAFATVTLGVNQHVAGLGLTLLMISFCNTANRIIFTSDGGQVRVDPWQPFNFGGPIFSQYWMTYATFLIAVPFTWWLLWRSGLGLKIRAVGENPEAADVAGIGVAKTRYTAIIIGSLLMAAGGAFITLAFVGTFTINIINGRGWVALALVIFGRWKIGRLLAGAALFSVVNAGQLQLRLLPSFSDVPFEILLALPFLAVIIGLAVSGRNVPYPGAYLKPYKRL
jgi:ABC-type uncharacterized transport system permease subunit